MRLFHCELRSDHDVVFVRKRARELARLLGFDSQDQTRIGTAVSEVARNAYEYAGGGQASFYFDQVPERRLVITIRDKGKGITDLAEILSGDYQSKTGMGLGLSGTKRLMDEFNIQSSPGAGTAVTLAKLLPSTAPLVTAARLNVITDELMRTPQVTPLIELQEQNQELLRLLSLLREKQDALTTLNRELEETNRGVVALYGQLDEKAEALRKTNAMKTRFLSNITHEFRAPLGASINLAGMLLDGLEGPLNEHQSHTVSLIQKSNQSLLELVNDLLDLAKVEAGRIPVRPHEFELRDWIAGLQGLFRPMVRDDSPVRLEIQMAERPVTLFNDEPKLTQIVRNLVSNAIKYTEHGFVRVETRTLDSNQLELVVADSGIGIAEKDLEKIFEEFAQIDSPLQRKSKGTGIGLSLTRRLVGLLGGELTVQSRLGEGSRFRVTLPIRYHGEVEAELLTDGSPGLARSEGDRPLILMIDDDESERYFLRSLLVSKFHCDVIEAPNGARGLTLAHSERPALIFLDLNMPDVDGFSTLEQLKADPVSCGIPVVIHSGKVISNDDRARLAGAVGYLSKTEDSEEVFFEKVGKILTSAQLSTG